MPTLNKQELSRFLGVSRPIADRLIAEGLPGSADPSGRWKFDPSAVAKWLVTRAETTGGGPDVDKQRERLLRAQADRAELELAKARGALVAADDVARVWSQTWVVVRDIFRAIPRSCVDRVLAVAGDGRPTVAKVLGDEIDDALRRVATIEIEIKPDDDGAEEREE
jgi:phage terminase Nu1 subunit (DNA packaging protein)